MNPGEIKGVNISLRILKQMLGDKETELVLAYSQLEATSQELNEYKEKLRKLEEKLNSAG